MTGYWKNQRQYEGAVKVSAASMGGPGAGKVPGLPDVSGGSDQDRQDESEGKGCGVVPASASAKASGSLGPLGSIPGQSFLSESSDPLCCCEERVCRCTDEQRAYLDSCIAGATVGEGWPEQSAASLVSPSAAKGSDGSQCVRPQAESRADQRGVQATPTPATPGQPSPTDTLAVTLSLDGRERTYSGAYGVEKYERRCLHCGEWFELFAQPDEDRRLHCSKGCYRWADL